MTENEGKVTGQEQQQWIGNKTILKFIFVFTVHTLGSLGQQDH